MQVVSFCCCVICQSGAFLSFSLHGELQNWCGPNLALLWCGMTALKWSTSVCHIWATSRPNHSHICTQMNQINCHWLHLRQMKPTLNLGILSHICSLAWWPLELHNHFIAARWRPWVQYQCQKLSTFACYMGLVQKASILCKQALLIIILSISNRTTQPPKIHKKNIKAAFSCSVTGSVTCGLCVSSARLLSTVLGLGERLRSSPCW